MRRATILITAALLAGAAGCASTSHHAGSAKTRTTTVAPTSPPITTATTLPAAFTGTVDAFYDPPKPLPAAQPGTLIRYQPVSDVGGRTTWRILYHSIDAAGRDQPTPGLISFPDAAPTSGDWPVLSIGPGTVGLSTRCALSRTGASPDTFGTDGVVVQTDYIGMVDGQLQRYLSGPSEAHSMIDAVRAARNIPAAHAGTRWVAFGHSQGGHSALFTNQLAKAYAPELDLLGTVVGAPAAQLTRLYGPNDRIVPHVVELLGLFGIAQDHPGSDPGSYLTPAARAKVPVLEHGCMDQIIGAFAGMADHGLFAKDPVTTEPAATFVRQNDPGRVKAPSPILLFEGTEDTYVVPARAAAVRARLCGIGQTTQFLSLTGANHGTEIIQGHEQISAWIADRFAGEPALDNCPAK
ncbi:MAG: hypothetical protein JST73_12585 [Actinobacteria bacterium]|nr:hypothetical protein [Actinomycetota bacterium]